MLERSAYYASGFNPGSKYDINVFVLAGLISNQKMGIPAKTVM